MNLRRQFGVWVIGIKSALSGTLEMFPDPEFTFSDDQLMLVVGRQTELNRLREIK